MLGVKRVRECILHQDTINSVENEEEETIGECSKNSAHNSVERKKKKKRIEEKEEEKKGRRKKMK